MLTLSGTFASRFQLVSFVTLDPELVVQASLLGGGSMSDDNDLYMIQLVILVDFTVPCIIYIAIAVPGQFQLMP